MRILLINSEYPPVGGGASTASANIARTLVKHGHEVVVLTTRYNELPKNQIEDGIRIIRGPARRSYRERSTAWEQGLFILLGCLRAIPLVQRWRPQVTLAFFGAPSGIIALFLRYLFKLPYIVSLRGGDVPGFRSYDFWLYHLLITPLLHVVWRKAEAVVANSQGLREIAIAFNDQVEIDVIPNGVDVEQFDLQPRDWAPPHLLSVGRLVHQKGFDLLLKALSGADQMPWQLTIVGAGPRKKLLMELAGKLGISSKVHFAGWQSNLDLPTFYHKANIFILPSRNEGMPNAVLEAMSCGLPVVATDIAGNQELVIEGETGYLVLPESPADLQQKLETLMADAALCQRMGEAGRRQVENHYTWDNTTESYLNIMRSAVGGK